MKDVFHQVLFINFLKRESEKWEICKEKEDGSVSFAIDLFSHNSYISNYVEFLFAIKEIWLAFQ